MVSWNSSATEVESVCELLTGAAGFPERVRARPFGIARADLDTLFSDRPRPVVVTELLRECLRTAEGETFTEPELSDWTVLRRTRALLFVAIATSGPHREVTERCPNTACGELMQINLDLCDFRDAGGREEPIAVQTADGTGVTLRLPTAHDQLRLLRTSPGDALHFAASLVHGHADVRPEWLPEIEAALAQNDPLTAIQLITLCPYCETQCTVDLDLEALILREFERVQTRLLDCVHRIASAYGWSEEAVLAVPEHRRRYYLERIEAEAGA